MRRHNSNLLHRKATRGSRACHCATPTAVLGVGWPRSLRPLFPRLRSGVGAPAPCHPLPTGRLFDTAAAILLALVIGCGVAMAATEDKVWTRSEILAIADKEAQRCGYSLEDNSVSFHWNNSEWQLYLQKLTGKGHEQFQAKLNERRFLAVHYQDLERPTLGGELWVFLDLDVGRVIDTLPFCKRE